MPEAHIPDRRDPSTNVLLILDSEIKRVDDLRIADRKAIEESVAGRFQEIKSIFKMHVEHGRELAENEKDRLNALIDSVIDTAKENTSKGVETAANLALRVQTTADTVVTTTQNNADQLRNLITQKVEESSRNSSNQNDALIKRVIVLEEAKSENAGKERVADPMIASVIAEMKATNAFIEKLKGGSAGQRDLWGWMVAGVAALIAFLSYLK